MFVVRRPLSRGEGWVPASLPLLVVGWPSPNFPMSLAVYSRSAAYLLPDESDMKLFLGLALEKQISPIFCRQVGELPTPGSYIPVIPVRIRHAVPIGHGFAGNIRHLVRHGLLNL